MSRFFTVLAFAAQAAVALWLVATVGRRWVPCLAALETRIAATAGAYGLWMAAGVALVATAGSLYYSEVADFIPCELCWYQRIAMYPLVVVFAVGAARGQTAARFTGWLIAGGGLLISTYHYAIQRFPQLEATSCDTQFPCTASWIEIYDFVTIPYMAWSAFALILTILWAHARATDLPPDAASSLRR